MFACFRNISFNETLSSYFCEMLGENKVNFRVVREAEVLAGL